MRGVIILGSSGSIGTQALDVIRANPRRFEVVGLAVGSNCALLEQQAAEFGVEHTAVGVEEAVQLVRDVDADVVLNGITGSVGLAPTLAALERGTTLALANKESLIVGGDLVRRPRRPARSCRSTPSTRRSRRRCASGTDDEVRRLVLTASGGPFRGRRREELAEVTPAEALAHPTWDMGLVVTTNSATLVNKGLEVIEAHLLFDVGVRPHRGGGAPAVDRALDGRVRRRVDDRAGLAARHAAADLARPRLAEPGRRGAACRSTGPPRRAGPSSRSTPTAFPAVALAKQVGRAGGEYPAVFNAANEEAVAAFHTGRIGFPDIVDTVRAVVESHEAPPGALTVASLAEAERVARQAATARIARVGRPGVWGR